MKKRTESVLRVSANRVAARILVAATLVFLLSNNLDAQGVVGRIQGTVTDEQGGKVVGSQVFLLSPSGIQLSTTTDQSGSFEFRNLKPGSYLIEVKAEGFSVFASDEIRLDHGQSKQLAIVLRVASLNASVVVTATGTVQRADEVAKVVSTLDATEIEAKHKLTLAESLRGTPGLRVQQQGSPGALTTLRLRGQRNSDTAILLDGLRIRDAGDINGSAVSLISDLIPLEIDHVEILRGSGSSIYGTNAIGGVINIIPEIGATGFHFGIGFDGGSLATFHERIKGSGGGNRFGYNFGLNRVDVRHGVDGDNEYGNTGVSSRFQFNPTQSITIAGTFYGTIANARLNDSPFALPAAFASAELFPRAVAGTTFQPDFHNPDQGRRNRLLVGSARFSQVVTDHLSYTIAYQRVSSNRRNYNGPKVDPRFTAFVPFGDFEFFNLNIGDVDTLDSRLNIRVSASNLATIGFEFEHESFFQESLPSFSTFNNTTDRQRTFALFGQDQLSFLHDRLQLSMGIRGQSYRIRSADRPGLLQSRNAESSVTGDGAVAYFIPKSNTKLRAHVGNGFRAPSLFERFGEGSFAGAGVVRFGDPTLKAEQSISVDGGVDQRFAGDRVLLGITYFYTRLQRVIAFTGFSVDPLGLGRFSGYVNQPGGLSRGIESSLDASAWRGMNVRTSYTYTNSDRSVPSQGLRPEYVIPKQLFGLTMSQRYRSFLVNLDLNRTGSYLAPVFENNFPFRMAELRFDGYTKADLFAGYERRMSERLTANLFGGVENLFHQKYYENGFLAPGTVGRAGINLRF